MKTQSALRIWPRAGACALVWKAEDARPDHFPRSSRLFHRRCRSRVPQPVPRAARHGWRGGFLSVARAGIAAAPCGYATDEPAAERARDLSPHGGMGSVLAIKRRPGGPSRCLLGLL